jgi:predicted transcriptional regulator
MTPDQHRAELRRIAAERDRLTEAEPRAVVAALRAGVKQTDIARDIGRTREHVRRIARAHGIEG